MESILITIKKSLGIEKDYDGFDTEIIMGINSAFTSLNQLGIGPSTGYKIVSIEDNWEDFLGDVLNLESVKTYVFLKTRLVFDPPSNSFLISAITNQITELEWRLKIQADPPIV